MLLYRSHKLNQGMHIKGNGLSIDVIVVAIYGTRSCREACLEIIGVTGTNMIGVSYSKGLVKLIEDIEVGILNIKKSKDASNSVTIYYSAPKKYSFQPKSYN